MNQVENIELLDKLIYGRVTPHIYAFQTGTIPNYLKIGDTYRPVSVRLKEWELKFPDLKKKYEHKATVTNNVYFRDHAVHYYLETFLGKERLKPEQLPKENLYYSREFFKEVMPSEIDDAINDICEQYNSHNSTYTYYDTNEHLSVTVHYERGPKWKLRPNQEKAVDNFIKAIDNGRTNLLMYAVMRFGKSFTSLACAKAMNAKTVLIVSAKADVRDEWKKNIEKPGNFAGYNFLSSKELLENDNAIADIHSKNETAVIFLTLQDLQGPEIKAKHAQVFDNEIDLLIIDETHFGARAQSYGEILRNVQSNEEQKDIKNDLKFINKQEDEKVELEDAEEQLKELKAKIRLHLSGTPYRILMGSEFEPEDIISFVQFTDIAREQAAWDAKNLDNDDIEEWDNPYFGFPQMIRFAFYPSQSAIEKMNELKKHGVSLALSALFKPQSIKKDTKTFGHQKFIHEKEVFEFLKIIDGASSDSKLLGFLDYDKIKQGQMCRHLVMVLPYCASCDAMEALIQKHLGDFKNLGDYEILNISGVDAQHTFRTPTEIKTRIIQLESKGKKTLTLTVNRMLTGSTVEQWDTMIYLKDTASPQEYDQAIFRLQNQYVRELSDGNKIIKECLKPQTLLVDFDPHRLFTMQEQKSLIYNANTEKNGNQLLGKRIADELRISPIITMNHNRLEQVEASDILKEVSRYNNARSITDEVNDLPVDFSILNDAQMRLVIESQNPFGSKAGLTLEAHENDTDGQNLDIDESAIDKHDDKNDSFEKTLPLLSTDNKEAKDLENKIRTYYQRILFFSFLCPEPVKSLDDILETLHQGKNQRLSQNLNVRLNDLEVLRKALNAFKLSALDYKIQNISTLATDENLNPLERAITSLAKFSRMSVSEIITPIKVADEMIAMLPEDKLRHIITSGEKLLDIASKSGEYTVALVKRLEKVGFTLSEIKSSIYAIPTSSVAYEFTRRFYEILGLDITCIASHFTSYDLLDIKSNSEEVNYKRITELLSQKKSFAEITLQDKVQGGDTVKFGAIVGNPPYQESDGGAQASARPIYHKFVEIANEATARLTSLIIPTRWYAGGKGLDQFRDQMLSSKHISQLHDFINPETIFPGTNNRGGVCYFLIDKEYNSDISNGTLIVTYEKNNVKHKAIRKLNTFNSGMFMRDSQGVTIVDSILHNESFSSLSEHISSAKAFGFRSFFIKDKRFKSSKINLSDPVTCYGSRGTIGYVERKEVTTNSDKIDSWKVFVPRANNIGTELNDDNQNSFSVGFGTVCTETFVVVGLNLNLSESQAAHLAKYLQTKFARFLHSMAKISQDATRKTYRFVPTPNLDDNSPINWDLSLNDIDEQLFAFYRLTEEERQHIRSSIKDMD